MTVRAKRFGDPDLKRDSRVKFTRFAPREPRGVFMGQIPLEMLTTFIFNDGGQTDFYSGAVEFDPAIYPGVTAAFFETVISGLFSGINNNVDLVNSSGVVVPGATVTSIAGASYTRMRAAVIGPLAADFYMFRVNTTVPAETFGMKFNNSKLLLNQVAANRTRIRYPLIGGALSSNGGGGPVQNNQDAWANQFIPPSTISNAFFQNLFLKEVSKYGSIINWGIILNGYVLGAGTATAYLRNVTDNTVVAGSQVLFNNAIMGTRSVAFANNAANFDDLDEFLIDADVQAGTGFFVSLADLYVDLDCSASGKALIWQRVANQDSQPFPIGGGLYRSRYLHEPANYPPGTTFSFESTGTGALTNTLFDLGLNDVGIATVGVAGVNVFPGPGMARMRTAPIGTLVAGNRYGATRTVGPGDPGNSMLIVETP